MELNFEKAFRIVTRAMKLNQSHPFSPKDLKWLLGFLIIHGNFTSVFMLMTYNVIYVDWKNNDLTQLCKNGALCIVYFVNSYQYFILLWSRSTLIEVIEDINKDYDKAKSLSSDEREITFLYVKKGQAFSRLWLITVFIGGSLFVVKNIVLFLYYYCINDFRFVPFYDLIYPFPIIEENKGSNIFAYLFTYLWLLSYDIYSGIMYVGFVPLGPIFMLHACGQLELVKKRIDSLFEENDDELVMSKLKSVIIHMQYIYGFVHKIEKCFIVSYELTLKASTIMTPVSFYEVIESFKHGQVSVEFITFAFGSVFLVSSACYYGDMLMEKGEDLRLSIYLCGWEQHYDRRIRTTLQLMLLRALRPIAIQTIFEIMSLDTLTNVFRQSYAIFNLMNAAWN